MKRSFFSILSIFLPLFINASDITVVTMAVGDNYLKAVSQGISNKEAYCDQWGYDFVCQTTTLDPERPIPWSKIVLLLDLMETSSSKWFFWTDADSLVTNLGIPLEDFVDEDYNFIVSRDFNAINTGQFLIKNCKESREFLENVYARTEFIYHPWWENAAIIRELESTPEAYEMTKILPQRLFNSYPPEVIGGTLQHTYQPGDFIVHFASVRDNLENLFTLYSEKVVNDKRAISIDSYLNIFGYALSPLDSYNNEGYMTESQKNQFKECLASYPSIKSIAEIGLNGGHSLELLLSHAPDIENIISFDCNKHGYTGPAIHYFARFYKDQFTFLEGDSKVTVPEFTLSHPGTVADLIYVDGDHSYQGCLQDIINCRHLAHEISRLWVDDYVWDVQAAVNKCVEMGIIEIINVYHSHDPCGYRCWVEARYLK